jgi:predicted alpha/beta hydrolase family esterase
MKQVVVIHGGNAFPSNEEYLAYLRTREVDAESFKAGKDWKTGLQEALGAGFEVFQPRMPGAQNAHYLEWKIWFERMFPFLKDGIILVGHSLGGVFLAKYLSENRMPVKIRAALLVAAPFDADGARPLTEFVLPNSLEQFESQAGSIMLYASKDDEVVAFKESNKYSLALPGAHVRVFEGRGHFNQPDFPEIVADIRSL